MATIKSFDVSREGKDLRIQMQAGDMTVARLSRAFQASKQRNVDVLYGADSQKYFVSIFFQVESNSLYLKEEFGDMAYWPNDGGRFNVMHLIDGMSLQVMGEGLQADQPQQDVSRQFQHSQQGPAFLGFSYTGSRPGPMPFAANYRAPLFTGNTKKNKAIAKVILAEGNKTDKGGTSFCELGQTYVNITEDTANLTYITSKV